MTTGSVSFSKVLNKSKAGHKKCYRALIQNWPVLTSNIYCVLHIQNSSKQYKMYTVSRDQSCVLFFPLENSYKIEPENAKRQIRSKQFWSTCCIIVRTSFIKSENFKSRFMYNYWRLHIEWTLVIWGTLGTLKELHRQADSWVISWDSMRQIHLLMVSA